MFHIGLDHKVWLSTSSETGLPCCWVCLYTNLWKQNTIIRPMLAQDPLFLLALNSCRGHRIEIRGLFVGRMWSYNEEDQSLAECLLQVRVVAVAVAVARRF